MTCLLYNRCRVTELQSYTSYKAVTTVTAVTVTAIIKKYYRALAYLCSFIFYLCSLLQRLDALLDGGNLRLGIGLLCALVGHNLLGC